MTRAPTVAAPGSDRPLRPRKVPVRQFDQRTRANPHRSPLMSERSGIIFRFSGPTCPHAWGSSVRVGHLARGVFRAAVRSMATLSASFGSELMILREAALARADALAAFTTCFRGEAWVLRKAALLMWHTFATFAGDRALLFRVHRCEAAGRCLVVCFRRTGHSSSLIGALRLNAAS